MKGNKIDTETKKNGNKALITFESDHAVLSNIIVTGIANTFIQESVLNGDSPENVVTKVLETGATVLQNSSSRISVD